MIGRFIFLGSECELTDDLEWKSDNKDLSEFLNQRFNPGDYDSPSHGNPGRLLVVKASEYLGVKAKLGESPEISETVVY